MKKIILVGLLSGVAFIGYSKQVDTKAAQPVTANCSPLLIQAEVSIPLISSEALPDDVQRIFPDFVSCSVSYTDFSTGVTATITCSAWGWSTGGAASNCAAKLREAVKAANEQ